MFFSLKLFNDGFYVFQFGAEVTVFALFSFIETACMGVDVLPLGGL